MLIEIFGLLPLPPDECDETCGPVATADGAQVRVRGQQVVQHESVARSVNTISARNVIREAGVGRKILKARIMKLVRENYKLIFTIALSPAWGGKLDGGRFF